MKLVKKIEVILEILVVAIFLVVVMICVPEFIRYNRYLKYSHIFDAVADYAQKNNTLPVDIKSLCAWKNTKSGSSKWNTGKLEKFVRFEWASESFTKRCSSNIDEVVFISILDKNMKHQESYFNDRLRGLVKESILKKEIE